jgi:menaquinone-dependent protoporphyrinogen oxidase
MSILVVYASKHGATQGIAERIAAKLGEAGQEAEARPVEAVDHLIGYDAFVVGSAVYAAHWQKEASAFVRRNPRRPGPQAGLAVQQRPAGDRGRQRPGAGPDRRRRTKEIAEFEGAIRPKGHRVFFEALDPGTLGFSERAIRKLPVARTMLPEGDFRDWAEIDAWTSGIAHQLAQ